MFNLFKVSETENGEDELLQSHDDFYTCIDNANDYPDIKCFKVTDNGKDKFMIGIRISQEEVLWRIKRDGKNKRGRDSWFYRWKNRILSML